MNDAIEYERTWVSQSTQETRSAAESLAKTLPPGTVLALCGDLGAGKTCFVQGLALALGITQPVTSPTFSLVRTYAGQQGALTHVDLYRLGPDADLAAIGIDDCLEPEGLAAFEWADRLPSIFPPGTLWIRMEPMPQPNERRISVSRQSP